MFLLVDATTVAHAAENSGDAELAKAIGVPTLDRIGRIAVATSGPQTAQIAAAQAAVASAFAQQGHETVLIPEPWPPGQPDRVRLAKSWSELHASAVAVVNVSPPFDSPAAVVVLYDLGGTPLFKAFATPTATGNGLTWTGQAILDPSKLPGSQLYRELGRADLARRYTNRQIGKAALAIAGGVVILGSGLWQLAKAVATIDSSNKPTNMTFTEQAILAGGCATLLSPILIRTDPLTDTEREALAGWPPRLALGAAPVAAGGGMLSLAGSF